MPGQRCDPTPEQVPAAVRVHKISGDLAQMDNVDALVNPGTATTCRAGCCSPAG